MKGPNDIRTIDELALDNLCQDSLHISIKTLMFPDVLGSFGVVESFHELYFFCEMTMNVLIK